MLSFVVTDIFNQTAEVAPDVLKEHGKVSLQRVHPFVFVI